MGGRKIQLNELEGKEVVNLHDGARLGVIEEPELIIDPENGNLESLLIPDRGGMFSLFKKEQAFVIPWDAIVKIGTEIIIVDLPLNEEN